ncbi:TetR/AcrR family transcriptional regulator [Vibrio sp. T187]|uniref:TetR/AcrR family transcriptional regulator n=1 Tax=Vibrio TaxID=662 RepID=UPI0010C94041|nr:MULTISPECIES: TetR/AcrR family transcriptional regulator [Vibrio]MBW3694574.1 TetR/AcrR family transcriptional regulator [Vibrio sp. T187]
MTVKKTLSQKKREAIIEAAIAEFKDNGFQATSMDKISTRASVSKRTVYNHFESKDALFNSILTELWKKGLAATEYAFNAELPLEEQLTEIAFQELKLLSSEGFLSLSRVLLAEYFNNEQLAQQAMEKFAQAESGLNRWIKAAIEANKLKQVCPDFTAMQFISLIKAFAFWPQVMGHAPFPNKEEQNKIVESAVEMFLNQYKAN